MRLIDLVKMTDDFTMLHVSEQPLRNLFERRAEWIKDECLNRQGRYIPGKCSQDPYLTCKVIGINGGEDTLFVVIETARPGE